MRTQGKLASQTRLMKDVRRVLETPFWIQGLEKNAMYERLHDDHDGEHKGTIQVAFSDDGDVWVTADLCFPGQMLRFRTFTGGGLSLRTRNALMILAEAIKRDNEERPL